VGWGGGGVWGGGGGGGGEGRTKGKRRAAGGAAPGSAGSGAKAGSGRMRSAEIGYHNDWRLLEEAVTSAEAAGPAGPPRGTYEDVLPAATVLVQTSLSRDIRVYRHPRSLLPLQCGLRPDVHLEYFWLRAELTPGAVVHHHATSERHQWRVVQSQAVSSSYNERAYNNCGRHTKQKHERSYEPTQSGHSVLTQRLHTTNLPKNVYTVPRYAACASWGRRGVREAREWKEAWKKEARTVKGGRGRQAWDPVTGGWGTTRPAGGRWSRCRCDSVRHGDFDASKSCTVSATLCMSLAAPRGPISTSAHWIARREASSSGSRTSKVGDQGMVWREDIIVYYRNT